MYDREVGSEWAGHPSTNIAGSIDKMRAGKRSYTFHEHVIEHIPVATVVLEKY